MINNLSNNNFVYHGISKRTARRRLKRMVIVRHPGYVSYKPKMRKRQLKNWWYIRYHTRNGLSIIDFSKVKSFNETHYTH